MDGGKIQLGSNVRDVGLSNTAATHEKQMYVKVRRIEISLGKGIKGKPIYGVVKRILTVNQDRIAAQAP